MNEKMTINLSNFIIHIQHTKVRLFPHVCRTSNVNAHESESCYNKKNSSPRKKKYVKDVLDKMKNQYFFTSYEIFATSIADCVCHTASSVSSRETFKIFTRK